GGADPASAGAGRSTVRGVQGLPALLAPDVSAKSSGAPVRIYQSICKVFQGRGAEEVGAVGRGGRRLYGAARFSNSFPAAAGAVVAGAGSICRARFPQRPA